jgi:hypothetical protein
MWLKDSSGAFKFWMKANGSAFFKGNLHAETFSSTNAVIDTLHIKDKAGTVHTSVYASSATQIYHGSWSNILTLTHNFVSNPSNTPVILVGATYVTYAGNNLGLLEDVRFIAHSDQNPIGSLRVLIDGVEKRLVTHRYHGDVIYFAIKDNLSGVHTITLEGRESKFDGGFFKERSIIIMESLR